MDRRSQGLVKHLRLSFSKSSLRLKTFNYFAKGSILDNWLSSQNASDIPVNNQNKSPSLTNSLWDKNATFNLLLFAVPS